MKKVLVTAIIGLMITASPMTVFAAPKLMPDGGVFDPQYYAETYPDVKEAFGTNENLLYNHYCVNGKEEGRLPYNPSDETVVQQILLAEAKKPKTYNMQQLMKPSQTFVEKRLALVPGITGIQSVTEDHDPNRQLNKSGGYISSTYFTYNGVPMDPYTDSYYANQNIVEKGTICGGNIEVYRNTKDANARNAYLSAFDSAGFLNSGSHMVSGTCVIRTSKDLTATQQNMLTQQVVNALAEVR